jgi:hypothetical protein
MFLSASFNKVKFEDRTDDIIEDVLRMNKPIYIDPELEEDIENTKRVSFNEKWA